jgi:DNA-binding NtrC family response regulator
VMSQGGIVTSQHLYLTPAKQSRFVDLDQKLQSKQTMDEIMAEMERQLLQQALLRAEGKPEDVAKMLGVDEQKLIDKLKAYELAQ